MKIEKVNDNQIRCTLTKGDLADRQIKLSEIAYGSQKARELFRDMIQQANYEFGFETDDIPLMVEAIPLPSESIVLLITKVEYPEELDTRFSRFTEAKEEDIFDDEDPMQALSAEQGADDILGFFRKLKQEQESQPFVKREASENKVLSEEVEPVAALPSDIVRMYEFSKMESIEKLARIVDGYYSGENSLFKDVQRDKYILILHKNDHTPEVFNKICNIVTEYGQSKKYLASYEAHFTEHGKLLISNNALQTLASL